MHEPLHGLVTNETLNAGIQATLDQIIPLNTGGIGPAPSYQVLDARQFYTNDKVAALESAMASISYGGVYIPPEWGLIQTDHQILVPAMVWVYSGGQYGIDPTLTQRSARFQASQAMTSVFRLMGQSAGLRGLEVDANNLAQNCVDCDPASAQNWVERIMGLNFTTFGVDFGQSQRSGMRDLFIQGNGAVGTGVRVGVDGLFGGTNRIKQSNNPVELHGGGAMMGGSFHLTGVDTTDVVLLFSGSDCIAGGAVYLDTATNHLVRFAGSPGPANRNRLLGARGRNSPSVGATGKSVVMFDSTSNPCLDNFIMGFTVDKGSRTTGWDNFMDFIVGGGNPNGQQMLGSGIRPMDCTALAPLTHRSRYTLDGTVVLGGGGWVGAPLVASRMKVSVTQSGNGSAVQLVIAHGLCAVPIWVGVDAGSSDAGSSHFWWTADATNVYINVATPWPSGAGNLTFSVEAEV